MLADINGNLADLRSEAMTSQRFCLRWNNHQSNLLSVFDQLLHDEAFVDVTLAVEGQLLRAHKMVLSACSPYFQALFTGHPDKHPIVILKDVPYVDMRSLLDFMYRGEVSVDQDRLTAFLRVAESLRIKGLTEVNEDKCDLPSITSSLLGNQNTVPPPPPNLHRINQIGSHHHHVTQKRFHHMSSHPLLGSALTAPKRKRGRPRKLSGSSDTPIEGQDMQSCSTTDLVQGSPEMMEMKMGIDFQSDAGGNGNANNNNNSGSNHSASSGTPGPITGRKDEPMENGERDTPEPVTPRIKREPEPTPSTSAQDYLLPNLPTDITFEICTLPSRRESSSPGVINDTVITTTTSTAMVIDDSGNSNGECAGTGNCDNEDIDDEEAEGGDSRGIESHTNSNYIKTERMVSGIHFLTTDHEDDDRNQDLLVPKSETPSDTEPEVRKQLLEYMIQNDGSVICKWCGEVLPSRTRWYRHKYKLHVSTQVTQPAPLFKCHSCNAYFKSRKGYIGHLSSRHSSDNDNNENDENREEPVNKKTRRASDIGKGPDWEQQREKEEKLVADIIDRVKRECEAQGETVTRRGYSRRTTVMNS
ncbi:modifier of mdg4-like isoform X1 [Cotesia glomerata]|uniref:modifier of mdg4-like isoform X1 n=1 Tax=Cotesia glomerata TaxID=32391 RepID=UPI001D0128D3|nr:modifier of mdg4-like isoform X1 [Cotesia glomerata]XP_044596111.1 modifier of mdg4-like isoform X1 [Cotesia glomerata]XP_044596112.1 modifier of mdg4-like isoform X1 [Cotesia glomerata]XP_044596113.1 modifier of mdg4-like isoform X1 [Cotesia glomerata]XP_044596114.1 modifier of mdg4-like isoform X1 [Cotesia glomerata]XP_044596115.1 modifier of mdg4-like isoform X1 [Cotesia glomerata]XP_044596116.1 modifier of mdg4-like isoform X1 [Cotesia glomerata]XP_044596117.1 modifier of mdg4-like is